jgi:IS30 family transposase
MIPLRDRRKIVRLRKRGYGLVRIAKDVGVCPNTVRRYIR